MCYLFKMLAIQRKSRVVGYELRVFGAGKMAAMETLALHLSFIIHYSPTGLFVIPSGLTLHPKRKLDY
jgi:hypothetical protein